MPSTLPDDPVALRQMLLAAFAEIERQRLIIAALQRNRFGRRSEKLDEATVQQWVEDPCLRRGRLWSNRWPSKRRR